MIKTSVTGFPRIGADRELKRAVEGYFKGKVTADELNSIAEGLKALHINQQVSAGIDYVTSNDFSYYDLMLDTAVMLNIIPARYRELNLSGLDTFFAMAKGHQSKQGDVKALAMKKWFNTNYHYIVPEIDSDTVIKAGTVKAYDELGAALKSGVKTKPVLIGPFTFLKLCRITDSAKTYKDYVSAAVGVYKQVITKLVEQGAELIQIDEPILVTDLTADDIKTFVAIYKDILGAKAGAKILLQTYFGDIRDIYQEVIGLGFDAIGLDFVEGEKSLDLIKAYGFPKGTALFAGVVNGKNIWRNNYAKALAVVSELKKAADNIVISTSCSLLHSPYTVASEKRLGAEYLRQFAFAVEKLDELKELSLLASSKDYSAEKAYIANQALLNEKLNNAAYTDKEVRAMVKGLKEEDFVRVPAFDARMEAQNNLLKLPVLPTTTIGSFPQTAEVKQARKQLKEGAITKAEYETRVKGFIADSVKLQEELDIDVLVHGEFERNDMVEYFGENLSGFLFTDKAWVQSYGTRCVKPPVIWGDVRRKNAITVEWSKYAQSLTKRPMKGMLTGPVTILNWSFPREDMPLKDICYQIGFAIKDEVLDLERNGIKVIQIDEAALREKLPLRRGEWDSHYLSWAIKAFRLVHSKVAADTQIHTHMCYSEFNDIIKSIDDMDADVISFEASRSDLSVLEALKTNNFRTQVGPGVYDIHSPRVPSVEEIVAAIGKFKAKLDIRKIWINPDCGLKTRGWEETIPSLKNMVIATKQCR